MHFILDKILKLLTYYTPFYHQSLQSYLISKTVRFFGPPCTYWLVEYVIQVFSLVQLTDKTEPIKARQRKSTRMRNLRK